LEHKKELFFYIHEYSYYLYIKSRLVFISINKIKKYKKNCQIMMTNNGSESINDQCKTYVFTYTHTHIHTQILHIQAKL
jgi:hypothetical protein